MAKFYGAVGYISTSESPSGSGVWVETATERNYYGDIQKNYKRTENGEGLNDNVVLSNIISVLADPYALQNFFAIKYVTWMSTKWKVTSVEVEYPRLILTLGGVYNGPSN